GRCAVLFLAWHSKPDLDDRFRAVAPAFGEVLRLQLERPRSRSSDRLGDELIEGTHDGTSDVELSFESSGEVGPKSDLSREELISRAAIERVKIHRKPSRNPKKVFGSASVATSPTRDQSCSSLILSEAGLQRSCQNSCCSAR